MQLASDVDNGDIRYDISDHLQRLENARKQLSIADSPLTNPQQERKMG